MTEYRHAYIATGTSAIQCTRWGSLRLAATKAKMEGLNAVTGSKKVKGFRTSDPQESVMDQNTTNCFYGFSVSHSFRNKAGFCMDGLTPQERMIINQSVAQRQASPVQGAHTLNITHVCRVHF